MGPSDAGIGVLLVGLLFYFLPALVAAKRGHRNATSIFVLNLLLGWTLLGWVIALVWAFSHQDRGDGGGRYDRRNERDNVIHVDRPRR